MRVIFNSAEGIKKGYVIRFYERCGHRFLVQLPDGTTHIVDLAQIRGTRELRLKS